MTDFFRRAKDRVLYFATHYTWAFVAIMTLTLVSCAFSIHYLATLEANLQDLYENDIRGGDSIQSASQSLQATLGAVKDLMIFPDPKVQARSRAEVQTLTTQLRRAMDSANPKFYTPKARQAFLASKVDFKDYLKVLQSLPEGSPPSLKDLNRLEAAADVLDKDFDLLILNRIANSSKGVTDLVFQLRLSLVATVLLLVVTVVVRVVLYYAGHPRRRSKP